MVQLSQSIKTLNSKFIDKQDSPYRDSWTIQPIDKLDMVYGDCEDYSLAIIYLQSNCSFAKTLFNILVHKYTLYYVQYPANQGHVILKVENNQYIDNIQRRIVTKEFLVSNGYSRFVPLPNIFVLLKIAVGKFI